MFRRLIVSWLFALSLAPALAHAADVHATLDRSQAQLGDTVTLNVRVENAGGDVAQPDLSPLAQDFTVLGMSQNRSPSVVNGTATSSQTFGIALRPRHAGTLQVPSIAVAGGHTEPLQLEVTATAPDAALADGRDVMLETSVEPAHGYVGQQLSYVVRLYYTNLSKGDFDTPGIAGVEMSQLGDDLSYDAERGGRSYHVLERRFSLIPQRAGQIEIPAATFQGLRVDPMDPDSFFGSTTPVSAGAPPVPITVKPAPAGWGTSAWLPARQLTLTVQGWPGPKESIRVGQPINLTMEVQATGLPYETLPALGLPALDGAKAYPDKPASGNRQDGPWVVGHRQQAFAIVPERAGTLTIPATTLKWWNVLTDHMEVATVPAHRITVLPAPGMAVQTPMPSDDAGSSAASGAVRKAPEAPWRWIALGSLALWLVSALGWWLWHRRRASALSPASNLQPASARQQRLAFLAAARGSDASVQLRSLLTWARAERPAIRHPSELAAALDDPAQRAAIEALQQRQYGNSLPPAGGPALADVFKRGLAWRSPTGDDDESSLPPLYPFKLH